MTERCGDKLNIEPPGNTCTRPKGHDGHHHNGISLQWFEMPGPTEADIAQFLKDHSDATSVQFRGRGFGADFNVPPPEDALALI